jgi:hypothetical protein
MGHNGLAFVANPMYRDNAPAFHEKPQNPCVQFADMTQLKYTIAQSFT